MNKKTDFYLEEVEKLNNNIIELKLRMITFLNDNPIPLFQIITKTKKEVIDIINNGTNIYVLIFEGGSPFGKSDLKLLNVVDNTYLRIDNEYILEDYLGNFI